MKLQRHAPLENIQIGAGIYIAGILMQQRWLRDGTFVKPAWIVVEEVVALVPCLLKFVVKL